MHVKLDDCPACQGEGVIIHIEAGYSTTHLAFEAEESYQPCELCLGEGKLELCVYCHEPFAIKQGREVCGCQSIGLANAA